MKIKRKRLLLLCSATLFAFWLTTIGFISGCAKRPAYITALPSASSSLAGTPVQSMPVNGEELWVIARGDSAAQPTQDTPGSGALMVF